MLVRDGAQVVVICRGQSKLPEADEWSRVRIERGSYGEADARADWSVLVEKVLREGDTLIDILGADLAGTYEVARQRDVAHVIACGSVWMLGEPKRVPFNEISQTPSWDEGYASRWKVIQDVLRRSIAGEGPLFTAILPPNISGPGKIPLETQGGRDIAVHRALMVGKPVLLPEGPDVLIGPCDAEDVARPFCLAARQPQRAAGEIFNVGSAYALTASEFVATYGRIYGVRIPIRRVPWKQFAEEVVPDRGSRYHFEAHMCPDISKLRQRLGCEPRHTPEQSLWRAVEWMRQRGLLD
jgi:nucleoside-diphosphate-sugar epimerase